MTATNAMLFLVWLRVPALACCVFSIAAGFHAVAARATEPVIVLYTHDEEVGSDILQENPAVETVRCIFGRLGRRVDIRRAPRLRNRGLLLSTQIDGIFPNLPDAELNAKAVASEPFVLERWSYIQLRSSSNQARPRNEIVGTVLGSNESRFLSQQGARVFDAIPSMESLVRLLVSSRVPYVMVDDWSFGEEAASLGHSPELFRSAIVRYVPLQVYFSKPFAEANPGLVSSFNESIQDCVHGGRRVTAWEREVLWTEVQRIISKRLEEIAARVEQHQWLERLDPFLPRQDALSGADRDWQESLSQDRLNTLMEAVLSNPMSDLLRGIAAENPMVTEIFVTNDEGFVIGLNRLTSDFWQGDEDAAQALLVGRAFRHFSDFEYDRSTRRFQVKLSLPVHGSGGHSSPIGMVTIGLDAARLLVGRVH
ncbi:hypothetical protein [Hwanghaeella sp.]|uniref:hypothetical protein n=1 Tax=Hwanghaeella sp. TaxID=2605943 RepID=UPI003CCC1826